MLRFRKNRYGKDRQERELKQALLSRVKAVLELEKERENPCSKPNEFCDDCKNE